MKEIQRYSMNDLDGMVANERKRQFIVESDHLAAIEEAKKEERDRMMRFAEWMYCRIDDNAKVAFDYWQKNVENKNS